FYGEVPVLGQDRSHIILNDANKLEAGRGMLTANDPVGLQQVGGAFAQRQAAGANHRQRPVLVWRLGSRLEAANINRINVFEDLGRLEAAGQEGLADVGTRG